MKSVGFRFDSDDSQIMLCPQLDKMTGFTAKAGTGVEIPTSGHEGTEQLACQLGCFVLDLEESLVIPGEEGESPLVIGQHHRLRGVRSNPAADAPLQEQVAEGLSFDQGSIHPQNQQGFAGIGGTDPPHLLFAEVASPAIGKPSRVIETGPAIHTVSRFGESGFLPDCLTEDAVDKTVQSNWHPGRLQGIDGFVDGGRFGYAIKKEELIQSDLQRVPDKGVESRQRMPAQADHQEFEVLPLAQDAIDDVHGQGPVIRGQSAFCCNFFEKRFD